MDWVFVQPMLIQQTIGNDPVFLHLVSCKRLNKQEAASWDRDLNIVKKWKFQMIGTIGADPSKRSYSDFILKYVGVHY